MADTCGVRDDRKSHRNTIVHRIEVRILLLESNYQEHTMADENRHKPPTRNSQELDDPNHKTVNQDMFITQPT